MGEIPAHVKATMPWSYVIHPNGFIQVFGNDGKEVPITDMIEVACLTSRLIASKG